MNNQKIIKYIVIIVVLIIMISLLSRCSKDTAKLELIGGNITIYQNDRYIEPGYNIVETNNKDGFYINVDGYVNTNKVGIYNLEYMLYNKNGDLVSKATRTVRVLEDNLSNITLYLIGDEEEYFFIDDYVDHGVEAYNKDVDISNDVIINSNVEADRVGNYRVTYQITNDSYTKEITRKVYIIDYKINETIDDINLNINLLIDCEDYYYTILPDGNKEYSRDIIYQYNDIGEYEFDIYLKNGSHKKYTSIVDHFDREGPIGSCTLYYDNNQTNITLSVTDEAGILKYSYNGLEFYNNSTIINSIITNVSVRAYDKHNNYRDIKCNAKLRDGFRSIAVDDSGHVQGKSGYINCGTSITQANLELDNLMKAYGYKTREAVAAAATYLANYKYNIPYFWGGKSVKKGLDPNWGCKKNHSTEHNCSIPIAPDKSYCAYGLDCGGLVRWSFVQAGFDTSVLRGDDLVTHRWGTFNPNEHKYSFNTNNMAYINQIKPGDIVHKPDHVAIVIGVDHDTLQIAEMTGPIIISVIRKSNGASINRQNSFTEFVLMDEFYKIYGN